MRYALLTAAALAAATLMSQADAATKSSRGFPTWGECYWLGWDRGVHVEQDELDGFMEQCLSGAVPFDNEAGIRLTFPAHEGREVAVTAHSAPVRSSHAPKQPVLHRFHDANETTQ